MGNQVNEVTEDPGLLDVLDAYWLKRIKGVHTCFPGKVVEYDSSTDLAVITPLLKVKFRGKSPVVMANLQDVPIVFPRTVSGGWFPKVAPGDIVTVICAERSTEDWLSGSGNAVYPSESRNHDLSDAYALLGGYPEKKPFEGSRDDSVNEILVKSGEKLKIGNGTADLVTQLDELADIVSKIIVAQGTGPDTGAITTLRSKLAQIKA